MDISGITATQKPPWEQIVFQQAPYPDEKLFQQLSQVTFDASWNELPHDLLNQVKAKIEPLEKNHQWELLKKRTNPYELVYTQDSSDCPPSISMLRPLSRSYFKMIEILNISHFFERIPKTLPKVRTAHVAEGPGGFIEAFLDRASFYRTNVSKIFAMTLKPTNNHIPGWRRAYTFLQKHPEVKIHYGQDGTGDLYKPENQTSFIDLFQPAKALLFTGDGGFDFSVDYENQERSMFLLLIASAITGLQVLTLEGTLVLKLFDLFSPSTQFLLRCITLCFKDWVLYKPSMSRPCNSERYLVCRGFRRTFPQIIQVLKQMEQQAQEKQFCSLPPFSFFTEKEKQYLEDHTRDFNTQQIENIERTIALQSYPFEKYDWKPQYALAQKWCSYFSVPYLKPKSY
jgi:23S rRNA U2552 (ribose-2'-O)-methylase RlmE/FtsJ